MLMKNFLSRNITAALGVCLLLPACGDPVLDADKAADAESKRQVIADVAGSFDEADAFRVLVYLRDKNNLDASLGLPASEILKRVNAKSAEYFRNNPGKFLAAASGEFEKIASNYERDGQTLPCAPENRGGKTGALNPKAAAEKARRDRIDELLGGISYEAAATPGKKDSLTVTIRNDSDLPVTGVRFAEGNSRSEFTVIPGGVKPGGENTVKVRLRGLASLEKGLWVRIDRIVFKDAAKKETYDVTPYDDKSPNQIFIGGPNDGGYPEYAERALNRFLADEAGVADVDVCAGYDEYADRVRQKLAALTAGEPGGAGPGDGGGGTRSK